MLTSLNTLVGSSFLFPKKRNVLGSPANLLISDITETTLSIQYDYVSDADAYIITTLPVTSTYTTAANTYTLTGLTTGVEYTVSVQAKNTYTNLLSSPVSVSGTTGVKTIVNVNASAFADICGNTVFVFNGTSGFYNFGNIISSNGISVRVLAVGGGGGGGAGFDSGGGGGGGGVVDISFTLQGNNWIEVNTGAGGIGGDYGVIDGLGTGGGQGGNTQLKLANINNITYGANVIAFGGGGGGEYSLAGTAGGSGGGAGYGNAIVVAGTTTSNNLAFSGGKYVSGGGSAGGGGAGSVGLDASGGLGGAGGAGYQTNITGSSLYWAGGGGGVSVAGNGSTDNLSFIGPTFGTTNKYSCAVYAPSVHKIYSFPDTAGNILVTDISASTYTPITSTASYRSATYAPNGKIYALQSPVDASANILVVDTLNADTQTLITNIDNTASNRSLSFAGNTTSYINVPYDPSMNIGTSDFTVEWYQYQTDNNLNTRIFYRGLAGAQTTIGVSLEGNSSSRTFYLWIMGSANSIETASYNNAWNHFAVCRSSGVIRVFKNGTQIGNNLSNTTNITSTYNLVLGNESTPLSASAFGGQIYGFNWINGVAKYTTTFSVPTTFTVDSNTLLFLTGTQTAGKLANTAIKYNISLSTRLPASISSISSSTTAWENGVLAPNGNIYFVPRTSTSVLIVNTANDTASTATITGLGGLDYWYGGVLGQNGKIYCAPHDSSYVMVINTNTNTVNQTAIQVENGSAKWNMGVAGPNGKVYFFPRTTGRVLAINTYNDAVDSSFAFTNLSAYSGVLAPNGNIYCAPKDASNIIILNPMTNAVTTFGSVASGSDKYFSTVIDNNGIIYGAPYNSTQFVRIVPAIPTIAAGAAGGVGGGGGGAVINYFGSSIVGGVGGANAYTVANTGGNTAITPITGGGHGARGTGGGGGGGTFKNSITIPINTRSFLGSNGTIRGNAIFTNDCPVYTYNAIPLANFTQKSMYFDGTTYVSLGNANTYAFNTGTYECLFKVPENGSGFRALMAKSGVYGVYLDASNCLVAGYYSGATRVIGYTDASFVNDNTWHHTAITFVQNGLMRLYLDGFLKGTVSISTTTQTTSPIQIGADNSANLFTGSIANARVWSTERSANDISQNEFNILRNCDISAGGLHGSYPLNDVSTNAVNIAPRIGGYGGSGAAIISVPTKNIFKKANYGITFTASTAAIQCTGVSGEFSLNSGTIDCWIKTENAGAGYRALVMKPNAYGLYLNNGIVGVYDWTTSTFITTNTNVADNRWHHIRFLFNDRVSNGSSIYVDKTVKATFTYSILNQSGILGIRNNTSNLSEGFLGQIYNVRIWNYMNMDFTNISRLSLSPEMGLVGSWPLNEGQVQGSALATVYNYASVNQVTSIPSASEYTWNIISSSDYTPTQLAVVNITETTATINFVMNGYAVSYDVVTVPSTSTWNITNNTFVLTGLMGGTAYTVRVYGVDKYGQRSVAVETSFKTFSNTTYYYKFDVGDFSNNLGIINYKSDSTPVYDASFGQITNITVSPVLGINTNTFTASGYTNSNQNGVYDASASSSGRGNNTIYFAFDNSNATTWITDFSGVDGYTRDPYDNSGNYVGGGTGKFITTVTTNAGTISGEWLQLKTPYNYKMTGYRINTKVPYDWPRQYTVMGSSNGTTWNQLDVKTVSQPDTLQLSASSFGTNSPLAITKTFGYPNYTISANNTRMFLAPYLGNIYTSTFNRITQNWTNTVATENTVAVKWGGCTMTYDGNRAIAVASSNYSESESVVSTWTARTSPTNTGNAYWRKVVWCPQKGIFVAISDYTPDGSMTSSDGINWSFSASLQNTGTGWIGLCWATELGLFVAVRYSGTSTTKVARSTDGITWTISNSSVENINWVGICWSPKLKLLVAVSDNGTTNKNIMTSTDGIIWTQRNSINSNSYGGICWAAEIGRFVAVSFTGTNRVLTSTDGTTWESVNAGANNDWVNICWSPQLRLFVAVASAGTNRVMTSPDGLNWTLRQAASVDTWYNVCWSPELGIFVAVATSGKIMSSFDGITWNLRTCPNGSYNSICWSPELGIFVAVATSGTKILTSNVVSSTITRVYSYTWNGNIFTNEVSGLGTGNLSYTGVACNEDGSRIAYISAGNVVHVSNWVSGNGRYEGFFRTLDTTPYPSNGADLSGGSYFGIAMSRDGNAIVYGSTVETRYAVWNGNNYSAPTSVRFYGSRKYFFFPDNKTLLIGNGYTTVSGNTLSSTRTLISQITNNYNLYLTADGRAIYNDSVSALTNDNIFASSITYNNTPIAANVSINTPYNHYRLVVNSTNPYRGAPEIAGIDISGTIDIINQSGINPIVNDIYQIGNGSLYLDKTKSTYIILPSFTTTLTGFSAAFWVRGDTDASNAAIFDFGISDASNAISARFVNGVPQLYMNQNNSVYTYNIGTTSLTDNSWNHIAWSISNKGIWTAYLNGIPTPATGVNAYPTQINRTTNYIGKYITDTTNARLSNIFVDDFRTFNSAIDSTQVANLYYTKSFTPGLAPTNLTILEITVNPSITLSFTANQNAASYEILTSPATQRWATSNTTITLTGLSNSTTYTIYVYGLTNFGERSSPATIKVTMFDPPQYYYKFDSGDYNGNGLIANYKTGSQVFDTSYSSTNNAISPIVTENVAVGTGAIYLNKTTKSNVILPSFTNSTSGMSLSVWFKSGTDSSNSAIFDTSGNGNILSARLYNGKPLLYLKESSTEFFAAIPRTFTDNSWNHLVWNIDASGYWSTYINGLEYNVSIRDVNATLISPTSATITYSALPGATSYQIRTVPQTTSWTTSELSQVISGFLLDASNSYRVLVSGLIGSTKKSHPAEVILTQQLQFIKIQAAAQYNFIASSADGSKLAALQVGDQVSIYTSTDSGLNWIQRTNAGNRSWTSIASSSDGSKLAATENTTSYRGYIYTSADSGQTWVQRTSSGSRDWRFIASSNDGSKLAAVVNNYRGDNGYIYTSTDSGQTWVERTNSGNREWNCIASSSDGTKLAATSTSGYIYTSADSGATWVERTSSGFRNWRIIASSSDGSKLAAITFTSSYIYTSSDSGATWVERTNSGIKLWYCIASSSDGSKLMAITNNENEKYIYTSIDYGETWVQQDTSLSTNNYTFVTCSSDGTKIIATTEGNYIYRNF